MKLRNCSPNFSNSILADTRHGLPEITGVVVEILRNSRSASASKNSYRMTLLLEEQDYTCQET